MEIIFTYFLSVHHIFFKNFRYLILKQRGDPFLHKFLPFLPGHMIRLFSVDGSDGKAGLKLVDEELTKIFGGLGNEIKGRIWGEGVWQKSEVENTNAMPEAYQAGCNA